MPHQLAGIKEQTTRGTPLHQFRLKFHRQGYPKPFFTFRPLPFLGAPPTLIASGAHTLAEF